MRTALLAAMAALVSAPTLAAGSLADVSIIDRDTGKVLPTHYHDGEYWVAGRPGAHYAIQINSRDHRRLLAVTSVDGVNILTGETAGHLQRGYVFAPWQGYSVAGWRKSDREIAAFTFTSIPKSYAARTGRPQNVGVIGVALFTERQLPPPPPVSMVRPEEGPATLHAPVTTQPSGAQDSIELAEEVVTGARVQSPARREADSSAKQSRATPSLGTGHGRREYSTVVTVPFERASQTPDEVIRIRYDSRENLVAMGVIRPVPPRTRPVDPFPQSRLGYVPDP